MENKLVDKYFIVLSRFCLMSYLDPSLGRIVKLFMNLQF
jgi:hypothetical protein